MNRNTLSRARQVGALSAVVALSIAGCSSESTSTDSSSGGQQVKGAKNNGNAQTVKGLSGTLNGAGATSQEDAQKGWIAGFTQANPKVKVNYSAIGSGDGRTQFLAGRTVFGGTDDPWEGSELKQAESKICKGSPLIEVPAYVGPIAVAYNLPGVDDIKLSPEVVAQIFAGKITKWNDKAIADLNKGVKLPSTTITPVHRADESGTTGNFTDYLSQVAAKDWTAGSVETWPKSLGGESADATSGVVGTVTQTEGAITYADAKQAEDLQHALVGVGSSFEAPTPEAAAKALEVSKPAGSSPTQLVYEIDRKTTAKGAYPIILASYIYTCQKWPSADDSKLAKAYMEYMVSPDGQQRASDAAGAAPLSSSVQKDAAGVVAKIQG